MILLASTKEFSKITANVTMGRTLECAEVTTLGRRTLLFFLRSCFSRYFLKSVCKHLSCRSVKVNSRCFFLSISIAAIVRERRTENVSR